MADGRRATVSEYPNIPCKTQRMTCESGLTLSLLATARHPSSPMSDAVFACETSSIQKLSVPR